MFGFRLLAIILGFICLASAGALVFHSCPEMAEVNSFIIRNLTPDDTVRVFIRSHAPADMAIKNIIKYLFNGYAIFAIGLGLLFLYAAINPLRMRPFVSVVMIGSVLWIAGAIWQGLSLEIYRTWWIGAAAGALILLILLGALFPKEKKTVSAPNLAELEDEQREELRE